MTTAKIRLLLADDHNVVRSGLRALLSSEADFEVVGEAASGREAVMLAEQLKPDIVVMDLAMPLLNGMEATRQVKRVWPSAKIVVLSAYYDDEHVERALAVDAAGYLLKQTAAADLIHAVREVYKGNAYFSPMIAERLREKCCKAQDDPAGQAVETRAAPPPELSVREAEVLQLIAEGFLNKQIASELHLSVKTVEKHRQSVMRKLNLHCIADLVRHAADAGFIEMRPVKSILKPL
jgi:DNA-binding NarL/FixJ family response regulator